MSKLIKEEDEKGRLHIDSSLLGESLVSKKLLKETEAGEVQAVLENDIDDGNEAR